MKWILLLTLCCSGIQGWSQEKIDFGDLEYSYVEDKLFIEPDDLVGYTFAPRQIKLPMHNNPQLLRPQSVLFRITLNQLYLERPLEKKKMEVFNIRNIVEVKEGFKISFVPLGNPSQEGYMVIFLNALGQAEGLVLQRGVGDAQEIYYQAFMPPEIVHRDTAYFTSNREKDGSDIVNIWKESFFPYKRLQPLSATFKREQRIYPGDSLSFFLEERLVDKGRREKLEHWVVFKQRPLPRFFEPTLSMPIYDQIAEAPQRPETMRLEVKRVREIEVRRADQSVVKSIALQLKHPEFDELIIHRGPQQEVESIEFMGAEYLLRPEYLHAASN